jgi:nitroreductase
MIDAELQEDRMTATWATDPATDEQPHAADDITVLERLLDGHHSYRAYRPDSVDPAVLAKILDVSRRTPSCCNTQPWHLTVTGGAGTQAFRSALTAHVETHSMKPDFPFPARYEGEYDRRRKECAWQLYESVGVARGDRVASARQTAKNFAFFGAPHVAIVTTESALGPYRAVDCGLYLGTFVLAAQSLGAIPQAALAGHAPFIRTYFGLPESRLVVCGISFGYPTVR